MTTYLVTLNSSRVRVQAESKDAAAVEAVRLMVRNAKEYNAKFSAQGLPSWAHQADSAEAYTVRSVRKAPVAA